MTPDPATDPTSDPAADAYAVKQANATAKVAGWLRHLIDPDQVVELRALRVTDGTRGGSTWAGTFLGSELETLARAALDLSGLCQGVYYTLNPLRPDRHVRRAPRVQRAGVGGLAHDADVVERRWMLVDVDPVKPTAHKDDSATTEEKAATLELATEVRAYMATVSKGTPILCDSGNGHHLLYRLCEPIPVKLPLDGDDVIRRVLLHLADKFAGDPRGEIDTKVFNPGRIVKFPGTKACKGEGTDDRPHRRSRVLEVPDP